jgi:uncharacterized membrane protein YeaQ/YmgE (transglycosylase-associated protein family)
MALGVLLSIIIRGLAGWIASITKKADTGLIADIVLGIAGARLQIFGFRAIALRS